jgi:hypothetical protein
MAMSVAHAPKNSTTTAKVTHSAVLPAWLFCGVNDRCSVQRAPSK